MNLRVIVTGVTGMVGEGVLHECLIHPDVGEALTLGRRPSGMSHPKLREIVHDNFFDLSPVREGLRGYDACFFCLGTSSVGMAAEEFRRVTYDLTMHAARTLVELNPGMVFCYVSGAGTDGTEKGRLAWARVKGKTENDLMKLPFRRVYAFRPGYLHPTPGLKNTKKFYYFIAPLYPVIRLLMPKAASTLADLGRAMINAVRVGYDKPVLEVRDIVELARRRG